MLRKITFYLSMILTGALLIACGNPIKVKVQNNGPDALENVVVRTDQDSYTLGNITPGESQTESFAPTGDTGLEIAHAGHPEWQTVNIYITRGYAGQVTLEMENGKLVDFTNDIR